MIITVKLQTALLSQLGTVKLLPGLRDWTPPHASQSLTFLRSASPDASRTVNAEHTKLPLVQGLIHVRLRTLAKPTYCMWQAIYLTDVK